MAGHKPEHWNTKAYTATLVDNSQGFHKAICFEVERITSPVEKVDVTSVVHLFSKQNLKEKEVQRPVGQVDFLLGNDMAGIHTTVSEEDVCENLRLLHSKFRSGKLLSGTHKLINPKPIQINAVVHRLIHAKITPYSEASGVISNTLQLNQVPTIINARLK